MNNACYYIGSLGNTSTNLVIIGARISSLVAFFFLVHRLLFVFFGVNNAKSSMTSFLLVMVSASVVMIGLAGNLVRTFITGMWRERGGGAGICLMLFERKVSSEFSDFH